ncbi:MAG: hypothetical protein NTU74_02330 [Deltaproteobacteria bacterium]|nr:hypothetical protein [Deltaproteobacteria bacterium]
MFIDQGENDINFKQIENRVDGFALDGQYIRFSSIAKLIIILEFYEQYPSERTQNIPRYKELPLMGFDGIIKLARGDALKGMIY